MEPIDQSELMERRRQTIQRIRTHTNLFKNQFLPKDPAVLQAVAKEMGKLEILNWLLGVPPLKVVHIQTGSLRAA